MNITIEQTKKLLLENQKFTQLGFSMMLTQMRGLYAKDPTYSTLQSCTEKINMFLNKFKSIMSADYAVIEKL